MSPWDRDSSGRGTAARGRPTQQRVSCPGVPVESRGDEAIPPIETDEIEVKSFSMSLSDRMARPGKISLLYLLLAGPGEAQESGDQTPDLAPSPGRDGLP